MITDIRSFPKILSRRALLGGGAAGAAVLTPVAARLLRASSRSTQRPQFPPGQANLVAGEYPPDWDVQRFSKAVANSAIAALVPIYNTGGKAGPAAWANAHGSLAAVFANAEESGLNAHMERNVGKYLKFRNEIDKDQVESKLREQGIEPPPNWWGRIESGLQGRTFHGWRTSFTNAMAVFASQAAAGGAAFQHVRYRPPARSGARLLRVQDPTGEVTITVCYDSNGNIVPCPADQGNSSGSNSDLVTALGVIGGAAMGIGYFLDMYGKYSLDVANLEEDIVTAEFLLDLGMGLMALGALMAIAAAVIYLCD